MIFNSGYYDQLERGYEEELLREPETIALGGEQVPFKSAATPTALGAPLNPMQHQTQALRARISEGMRKVEFGFMGRGKGNREQFTPESFDRRERQDMRDLARINEMSTSTHASPNVMGLAGFDGRQGFDPAIRQQAMVEIRKAVDFAAEATLGGAIVVHTGEWTRPISESFGSEREKNRFMQYEEEPEKAAMLVVDERTGRVTGLRKDSSVFEPVYLTAKDFRSEGKHLGTRPDGTPLKETDWVDINGNYINPEDEDALFNRVPKWNAQKTRFEVKEKTWADIVKDAERWNQEHPDNPMTPARYFVRTENFNRALQAKGNSLFHAQQYDEYKYRRDKIAQALEFYKSLDASLPEEEKWRLMVQRGVSPHAMSESESIVAALEREKKQYEDQMRHIHQSSAAADAQAEQMVQEISHIRDLEEYGIEQTSKSLAELGVMAMDKSKQHARELNEPLYIAPENYDPQTYGSHPQELIKIVQSSRKAMAERLIKEGRVSDEAEAKKLAEQHIKSTLDVGHMNMWRQHLQRKPGESPEQFDKRYKGWYVDQLKKMRDAKVLGHIHLTDNFGYHDEHLTPGQGNVPLKEAMHIFEKAGLKDFIVEPGSFNPTTAWQDTMSYFGTPFTTAPPRMGFHQINQRHFGYNAPSNYIVGAYSPSNEWRLWSEQPLE